MKRKRETSRAARDTESPPTCPKSNNFGKKLFLRWDPSAGQGLEVDEQEQRDKQGGQRHRKPANLAKK
jgi:hypothetical protein